MAGNLHPVQFAGVSGATVPYDPLAVVGSLDRSPAESGGGSGTSSGGGGTSSGSSGGGGSGILRGAFDAAKKVFSNPEVDSVAGDVAEAAPEVGIAALAL